MDIAKANANDNPTWEILDDYIEDYNLIDLSPNSMQDLAIRLKNDNELAKKFYVNQFRGGQPLGEIDQLDLYCQVSTSEMHAYNECYQSNGTAYPSYGKNFSWRDPQHWTDWLIGNWTLRVNLRKGGIFNMRELLDLFLWRIRTERQ